MEAFNIDLDSECVWVDDAWLNREDLVRKIKSMIDAGDFQIARLSQALENLTKALSSARVLALRISPEMSDALAAAAQQTGRPMGALAREAIGTWLAGGAQPAPQPGAQAPAPTDPAHPTSPTAPAANVTTEPASAEEAAHAVALTPKRPANEQEEKRWFDK